LTVYNLLLKLFDNGSILIDPGAWISHKHADHHAGLIDILIKRDQVCEVFYDQYKFFYNCDQNLAIKKAHSTTSEACHVVHLMGAYSLISAKDKM